MFYAYKCRLTFLEAGRIWGRVMCIRMGWSGWYACYVSLWGVWHVFSGGGVPTKSIRHAILMLPYASCQQKDRCFFQSLLPVPCGSTVLTHSPRGKSLLEHSETNIFRTGQVIKSEKLSVHGLLIGPVVDSWLNRSNPMFKTLSERELPPHPHVRLI